MGRERGAVPDFALPRHQEHIVDWHDEDSTLDGDFTLKDKVKAAVPCRARKIWWRAVLV